MSSPEEIKSLSDFQSLLSKNTYVLVDFWAGWCGPCKAIAPTFAQLAAANTKRGHLVFAKVESDDKGSIEVAEKYGVSALPTFMLFKSGTSIQTITGANPSALRDAVKKATADTKTPGAAFQTKGHVLGGEDTKPKTTQGAGWDFSGLLGTNWLDTGLRFAGLYFVSLFAFDAYAAAEGSAWGKKR